MFTPSQQRLKWANYFINADDSLFAEFFVAVVVVVVLARGAYRPFFSTGHGHTHTPSCFEWFIDGKGHFFPIMIISNMEIYYFLVAAF